MASNWATAMPPARILPTSLPGLLRSSLLSSDRVQRLCPRLAGSDAVPLRIVFRDASLPRPAHAHATRTKQEPQFGRAFPPWSARVTWSFAEHLGTGMSVRRVAFGALVRSALSSLILRSQPGRPAPLDARRIRQKFGTSRFRIDMVVKIANPYEFENSSEGPRNHERAEA